MMKSWRSATTISGPTTVSARAASDRTEVLRSAAVATHHAARATEVDVATSHEPGRGGSGGHGWKSQVPDTPDTNPNLMQ
jgi:hypothetical protein